MSLILVGSIVRLTNLVGFLKWTETHPSLTKSNGNSSHSLAQNTNKQQQQNKNPKESKSNTQQQQQQHLRIFSSSSLNLGICKWWHCLTGRKGPFCSAVASISTGLCPPTVGQDFSLSVSPWTLKSPLALLWFFHPLLTLHSSGV